MFYSERRKTKLVRRFITAYALAALALIVFVGGFYVGGYQARTPSAEVESGEVKGKDEIPPYLLKDVNFSLFWDVWNITKEKYLVQPVLDTELFYGALSGIVSSLGDPYSVFLEPETTRKFTEELAGMFEGIGAEIGIRKGQLVIVAPLPDTPAERAGLKAGDQILKIDKEDTLGMPLDVAVSKIRGERRTTVALTMFRGGWEEPREVPIVRDTINVKSVRLEIRKDSIAYLRIIYFNETTLALFEDAIQEILKSDARAIVLDLRNNPGGFLEVAVQVAAQWIDQGKVVVFQEFRGGAREAFNAGGIPRLKGIPTAVLINEGSASASEIVAGALRDHEVATLIGENSFGKGSVQTFEQLRGGSSVKLTVAHWLTPKGHKIDGEGIAPDIATEMSRDDLDNGDDPQLEKAIELLLGNPK